jgi:hypothetical protein
MNNIEPGSLVGRTALVIGGSRGVGADPSKLLAISFFKAIKLLSIQRNVEGDFEMKIISYTVDMTMLLLNYI